MLMLSLFALILLQFLKYALIIEQWQYAVRELMLLGHGFAFEAERRFNCLNSAAAINDGSAFKQISHKTVIGLVQYKTLCLLLEIDTVLQLDDM